jgi:hypothetical protein
MTTLAETITAEKFPRLEYLDLSFNCFDVDSWPELERLLQHPSLVFVNVCANAIASFESEAKFESINMDLFRKLIWISQLRLPGRGWIVSLGQRKSNADEVIAHHQAFNMKMSTTRLFGCH